jgi:hypothetical protein
LKKIAAACDVGLLVEFVPYSELINRVSGTPYLERGYRPETMNVPPFDEEEQRGVLESHESEWATDIRWLKDVFDGISRELKTDYTVSQAADAQLGTPDDIEKPNGLSQPVPRDRKEYLGSLAFKPQPQSTTEQFDFAKVRTLQ